MTPTIYKCWECDGPMETNGSVNRCTACRATVPDLSHLRREVRRLQRGLRVLRGTGRRR